MAEDKKPRKIVDWEAVEREYRAGVKTLRQLGDEHGCSHTAVMKHAARNWWVREKQETIPVFISEKDELESAGFIYVICIDSGTERFYKIGMAAHFMARFIQHQCASPFPIQVVCVYFVGNMRVEERALHHLFAEKKVRGEWFSLSYNDLIAISGRSLLCQD